MADVNNDDDDNPNEIGQSCYWFSFYDPDGDRIFHSRMFSGRCESTKANGQRCKRRTCFGIEYCNSHLVKEKKLQIRQSNIPNGGKGLFAYKEHGQPNEIIFKTNQKIINYEGEIISAQDLIDQYGQNTGPYAVRMSNDEYVDSALLRGVGSIANTGIQRNNCNCQLSVDFRNRRVLIKAIKNIRQGQELLLYYGDLFNLYEGTRYQVKPYDTLY
jgi:SET domain-containing protein